MVANKILTMFLPFCPKQQVSPFEFKESKRDTTICCAISAPLLSACIVGAKATVN